MSVMEFSVYVGFWCWKQDFRVKFIKLLVTRPSSPVQVKHWSEHDSKSPRTKSEKMKNSEDLVRKVSNLVGQGASSNSERNWWQGHTCRRGKDLEDSRTVTGRRRPSAGPKWVEAGRPRPFPSLVDPPFDLATIRAIYRPEAKSHASIHSSSAAKEQRREGHYLGEERVELVD
jgi:hypothetical protein